MLREAIEGAKKPFVWVLSKVGKEELAHVSTARCGDLKKGQYIVHNGFFGKLVKWDAKCATIEYICYTAGTKETGYNRSSKGCRMVVNLDDFRAATGEEVLDYL